VLLVGIMERLASDELPLPIVPFYGSGYGSMEGFGPCPPKNPLNLATGYASMRNLREHSFNIFEYAYLSKPRSLRTRVMAVMAAIIQLSFFSVLVVYNIFVERLGISASQDCFDQVVIIMVVSSALFAATVRGQYKSCEDFVTTMKVLKKRGSREIFLYLNCLINQQLGLITFFFNIYFILVSDTPTDAVLNSVALAFIIEVDDHFKPHWSDEKLEDAVALILYDFITEPLTSEEVVVKRDGPAITSQPKKLYIRIPDEVEADGSFTVSVFSASDNDPEVNVITSYQQTIYYVIGSRAREIHDAIGHFECLDNFPGLTAYS